MKILVANIAAAEEHSPGGAFIKSALGPITRRNMQLSAPSAELVLRFASSGISHPAYASCKYLPNLNADAIYPALASAEREGFDGAIIGCFGDPFLNAVRAKLDIPVVGFGESALLMAAMVGNKLGLVASAAMLIEPARRQVESYGLGNRLAGIVASTETPQEQEMGVADAGAAIESFRRLGQELIARGADVLVPACGLLSPALRLAPGAERQYPHGLVEVDGVPVIDVMGAAIGMAAALVAAKRAGSGWKSANAFSGASGAFADLQAQHAELRFWDC